MEMNHKARTERGDFLFTVKEYGPSSMALFIVAEPRTVTTSLLGLDAFLSFSLKTKNDAEAQRIADFLNNNLDDVSFTISNRNPMYDAVPPQG